MGDPSVVPLLIETLRSKESLAAEIAQGWCEKRHFLDRKVAHFNQKVAYLSMS